MTEFGVVIQVGEACFQISHVPIPMARGPSVPKIFGSPNVGLIATKFGMVTYVEK